MSFQDKVMNMFASVESRMEALAARMEARDQEIRQELAIYKTAVSARVMATHEAPRVEVSTATLYLTDNATVWWHRRFANIEKGTCTVNTWDAFKREIKRQFYPEDVAYLARKNMKRLKHMGLIHEYAEQELRKHGVQDLATTMMVAESLVDYRREDSSKPKPSSKGNQAKGKDKRKEFTPKTNCFLCDGPHWARDCPKRKALNAMIKEKEKEGDAQVGSLQLLNALKAKPIPKTPQSKGIMMRQRDWSSKHPKKEWHPWTTSRLSRCWHYPTTPRFEVHTDASDFAIGGVLMQERHPIAFENRKLNDTERLYTMQENEMTAIVHCLHTWRHYLLGSHFIVKTNNVATSYFQTQKKLSPKQARWQDFLAEFDYTLEYKPRSANHVADALSRKAELASMTI
ncbi:Retrovirus-related Pol polyprotein from transposon 17.6 [Vitis vinifera]|uniref:Retrovirus-related Pol polyprotein from transposon 17.6 n=1 Tax=Vitis vinifera TaxID=29760 RepID=A0A438BME4_VITVI|nr:Retrovirus-related Pol polyprotein from transposon 17.6 [Vitis vinifera]